MSANSEAVHRDAALQYSAIGTKSYSLNFQLKRKIWSNQPGTISYAFAIAFGRKFNWHFSDCRYGVNNKNIAGCMHGRYWCVNRRRQQHNAAMQHRFWIQLVHRWNENGNEREIYTWKKNTQNWIHSRILITSNCRTDSECFALSKSTKVMFMMNSRARKTSEEYTLMAHPYAHRSHIGTHRPLSDANHIPSHYFYVWTDAESDVSVVRERCMRGLCFCAAYKSGMLFITRQPRMTHRTKLILIHYYFSFQICYLQLRRVCAHTGGWVSERASVSRAAQSLRFIILLCAFRLVANRAYGSINTQDTLDRDIHCAAQKKKSPSTTCYSAKTIRCYALIQFSPDSFFFVLHSFCLPLLLLAVHDPLENNFCWAN